MHFRSMRLRQSSGVCTSGMTWHLGSARTEGEVGDGVSPGCHSSGLLEMAEPYGICMPKQCIQT